MAISKEEYHRRKAAGLCVRCGKLSAVEGKTFCQVHLERNNLAHTKVREVRRTKGLCRHRTCNQQAVEGKAFCVKHLTNNRSAGLKRRQDRIVQGCCATCGKQPSVQNVKQCTTCILKELAHYLWKDRARWKDLENLYEKQNGMCPYFGKKLTIGIDASIDHITPSSKGGTSDISNLQWAHKRANWMKGDQSEDKFLKECVEITAYRIKESMEPENPSCTRDSRPKS